MSDEVLVGRGVFLSAKVLQPTNEDVLGCLPSREARFFESQSPETLDDEILEAEEVGSSGGLPTISKNTSIVHEGAFHCYRLRFCG